MHKIRVPGGVYILKIARKNKKSLVDFYTTDKCLIRHRLLFFYFCRKLMPLILLRYRKLFLQKRKNVCLSQFTVLVFLFNPFSEKLYEIF